MTRFNAIRNRGRGSSLRHSLYKKVKAYRDFIFQTQRLFSIINWRILFFNNAIKKRKNTNFRDFLLFIKFAAFKKILQLCSWLLVVTSSMMVLIGLDAFIPSYKKLLCLYRDWITSSNKIEPALVGNCKSELWLVDRDHVIDFQDWLMVTVECTTLKMMRRLMVPVSSENWWWKATKWRN